MKFGEPEKLLPTSNKFILRELTQLVFIMTFLHLDSLKGVPKVLNMTFLNTVNMDSVEKTEFDQFEKLIQGLIDQKYGCCDDFMSLGTTIGLQSNIESLFKTGEMKSSGIGSKDNFHEDKTIRGDKINWIEDGSVNEFEITYLTKIDRFIKHLNNSCYTSIKSYESHYASYEKNSFYKRHLDQFKNQKGRQFSIILYLNQDWKEEDGGNLCLYLDNGEQKKIAPFGGRMVFFKSDEMEHEVLPSFSRSRNSIAGWLKNE